MRGLTEQQDAAMGAVNEECGEIVQVVGKILRFGPQAVDTTVTGDGSKYDNVADLEREAGQAMGAISYACQVGLLDAHRVQQEAAARVLKLTRIHGG